MAGWHKWCTACCANNSSSSSKKHKNIATWFSIEVPVPNTQRHHTRTPLGAIQQEEGVLVLRWYPRTHEQTRALAAQIPRVTTLRSPPHAVLTPTPPSRVVQNLVIRRETAGQQQLWQKGNLERRTGRTASARWLLCALETTDCHSRAA